MTPSALPWSRGTLLVAFDRKPPEAQTHLRLLCLQHKDEWTVERTVTDVAFRAGEAGPIVDAMIKEARHSLTTCACVSPLFDEEGWPT